MGIRPDDLTEVLLLLNLTGRLSARFHSDHGRLKGVTKGYDPKLIQSGDWCPCSHISVKNR
jgi:hypothetical protein